VGLCEFERVLSDSQELSLRTEISPEIYFGRQQVLSLAVDGEYASVMEDYAKFVAGQGIGSPVSEDLVTWIVVAMLTSMTSVLFFLG
jgi:hypothetical protein